MRGSVLAAAAALCLGGCDAVTDGLDRVSAQVASLGDGFGGGADATGEGIRTLSLLGGEVRVRGPEGYCVDQGASNARRGFAIMTGCALLSEEAAIMPSLDGLITVQFGEAGSGLRDGDLEALAELLDSDAGRALLARDGEATSVETVSVTQSGGAVLAWFADGSTDLEGTTGRQWRAFMNIGDRLTTVSVLSLERDPLSRERGLRLIQVVMAELVEVNAAGDTPANDTTVSAEET